MSADSFPGDLGELVRDAMEHGSEGRADEAAALYEQAFCRALAGTTEVPPSIVGRLAVIYRRLGRFDDEIFLLERYRDSLTDDELQARYRARLAKAYALAAQHRISDSVALASVRAATERSVSKRRRSRRRDPGALEREPDKEMSRTAS